jgi:Zn-finger nucleic acid-binding protein
MKCPACGKALSEIQAGGIRVDICREGCGGLWFDWFELSKVDEPSEEVGAALLALSPTTATKARSTQRRCPRCAGQPMQRHYFSVKRQVQVDECPACGGFWLDAGELARIRSLFESEESAREAAQVLFDGLVEEHFAGERGASQERLRRARRFAHFFRFLCPSYWIPGKQEWGSH